MPRSYFLFIAGLILFLFLNEVGKSPIVNWTERYSTDESIPFSNKIAYDILGNYFPDFTTNEKSIYESDSSKKPILLINKSIHFNSVDRNSLIDQISKGRTAYLFARTIDAKLLDSLGFALKVLNYYYSDSVQIRFVNPNLAQEDFNLRFKSIGAFHYYFNRIDTARSKVLAVFDDSSPAILEIKLGNGRLILGTTPFLFSNFIWLNSKFQTLIESLLSYFDPSSLEWDKYYKGVQYGKYSRRQIFKFLLENEPLHWAFYLTLFSILFFLLINLKRRQKIIPIYKLFKNSSLDFAETLAQLYYKKADHKKLAMKRIRFFKMSIKESLAISFDYENPKLANILSHKSKLSLNKIENLLNYMSFVEKKEEIDHLELKRLIHLFDTFFDKKEYHGRTENTN